MAEYRHLAGPTLGWKSHTGRPERKRFVFPTRSMGAARRGASALADQNVPQHVASVPIRLMFNAKHTRSHSPRTFAKPRRVYRRNPSTSLIHPFGASESHLRCAYRALPVRLASFSPMRCVAGSRAGSTANHVADVVSEVTRGNPLLQVRRQKQGLVRLVATIRGRHQAVPKRNWRIGSYCPLLPIHPQSIRYQLRRADFSAAQAPRRQSPGLGTRAEGSGDYERVVRSGRRRPQPDRAGHPVWGYSLPLIRQSLAWLIKPSNRLLTS